MTPYMAYMETRINDTICGIQQNRDKQKREVGWGRIDKISKDIHNNKIDRLNVMINLTLQIFH